MTNTTTEEPADRSLDFAHFVRLVLDALIHLPLVLPPVATGALGPVYEFRSYRTRLNGIAETQEKWRGAVPGRSAYSPLLFAGWGLDGPPRVAQIWPYASLAARAEARSRSVSDGAWPAKGGPDWLTPEMTSAIALPLPFSPLH